LKRADLEVGACPGAAAVEALELQDGKTLLQVFEQESEALRRAAAFSS
jgi:hypothetical protein